MDVQERFGHGSLSCQMMLPLLCHLRRWLLSRMKRSPSAYIHWLRRI